MQETVNTHTSNMTYNLQQLQTVGDQCRGTLEDTLKMYDSLEQRQGQFDMMLVGETHGNNIMLIESDMTMIHMGDNLKTYMIRQHAIMC